MLMVSVCSYRSRLMFVMLLMLSTAACDPGRDEIAYSMVAEISDGPTVEHVAVRFVDVPFYWEWGAVGEGGWKRYSDIEPRQVPQSLVLYWEKNGEKFEMPFAIDMPTPEILENIRNSGVNVNGRIFKSDLELRVEISPDQNTARVYWHEDRMPPASPPKVDASTSGPGDNE
jgi:hypothetical protein